MCRWLLFKSNNKVTLADLVLRSENSLVKQSYDATFHPGFTCENNANFNADGFGVGWYYAPGRPPAVLRSITPAWSDPNLREVCKATEADCILGHVRAASPGAPVTIYNCHPFRHGMLLFQHNGHLEGFGVLKRRIRALLPDHLYNGIDGTTDTEHIFAIFLSHLPDCCAASFTMEILAEALKKTIFQLHALVNEAGIKEGFSTFNIAITDGVNVLATRYCDKYPKTAPPSLYYCYVKHSELVEGFARRRGSGILNQPGDGSSNAIEEVSSPASKKLKLERSPDAESPSPRHSSLGSVPLPSPSVMTAQQIVKSTPDGTTEVILRPTKDAILIASEPLHHHGGEWNQLPANVMLTFHQGSAPVITKLDPPPTAAGTRQV